MYRKGLAEVLLMILLALINSSVMKWQGEIPGITRSMPGARKLWRLHRRNVELTV